MFNLQVILNKQHHLWLKQSAHQLLPGIKWAHTLEALARGFGFETYAALCVHAAREDVTLRNLDSEPFAQYLHARDFNVPPEILYRVAASVAIKAVIEKWPNLTAHGMALDPYRGEAHESTEHYSQRFSAARSDLLSPKGIDGFLCALAFLARVKTIRSINRKSYTYKLKHTAELYHCSYPTGQKLGPIYISNGMFITASVHCGLVVRSRGAGLPSAYLNLSERSIADLDCEIRPNGARAQERARREQLRELSKQYRLPQNRFLQ